MKHASLRLLAIAIGLGVFSPTLLALSSDRQQPISVEADRADIDDKRGVSVYTGNVVVVQGSLRITGDKMVIHTNDRSQIEKIVTTGKPSTFEQLPDNKQDKVYGRAQRMEYYAAQEKLILIEEGFLEQSQNTFRSDRITYFVKTDQVQAGKSSGGERVRIIIQPQDDTRNNGQKDGQP